MAEAALPGGMYPRVEPQHVLVSPHGVRQDCPLGHLWRYVLYKTAPGFTQVKF
jgi:hypothetical protein